MWLWNRQLFTYQNVEHEWEKVSSIFWAVLRKQNLTLEEQKQYKQAQNLWKIVKNEQSPYEKKVNKLKLKAAKSKTIASRPCERA